VAISISLFQSEWEMHQQIFTYADFTVGFV